jgi:hypothetical protein
MFIRNGKPLPLDTAWADEDGTQYPSNWLRLSTPEDRAAKGITEAPDPEPYDQRYYWGPGLPKDLDKLKRQAIRELKAACRSLLAETDWQVVRHVEKGESVSAPLRLQRQGFRDRSNEIEAAINACATVDALRGLPKAMPQAGEDAE